MQALARCTSLDDVPNVIAKVECRSELKRDMVALMSFFSEGDINKRKLSSWAFRQKVTATSINGQKVFWDFPLSGFNVSSYALTFQVICHWMADFRSWCASYRVWKKSSMWKLSLLVRLSFLNVPECIFYIFVILSRLIAVAMASFRRVNGIFDSKQFQSAAEIVHLQDGNGAVSLTGTTFF